MVWAKEGTNTLVSTSDTIYVSTNSLKFNMYMTHQIGSGNINSRFRANSDTSSSVYADRTSINGGADTERSPNNDGWITAEVNLANNSDDKFLVGFYCDISGEEKLFMGWNCDRHDATSSVAPERVEFVAKYVPSPDASISEFGALNVGSGDYTTGSNLSVLTGDETEIVTLQDGTIFEETDTNKAYIWSSSSETWTQL